MRWLIIYFLEIVGILFYYCLGLFVEIEGYGEEGRKGFEDFF